LKTDNILVGHNIVIPGDDKITEKKDTKPLEVLEPKKETKKVEAKQIKTEYAPKEIKEEKLEMPVQSETKLQAKPGTVVYVVRKNDSLWRIAQSCGTTPEKIAELNNFSKNAQLMPGKEILVPSE
jgi:LysM repeat protein